MVTTFLLDADGVNSHFQVRCYIFLKKKEKKKKKKKKKHEFETIFWIFTIDSDIIIFHLTILVKLFILDMVKK